MLPAPPALLSISSAIGLGFLINNAILQPMLIVFLLISVFGLVLGMRRHGSPWALIIGVLGAVTTYVFRYVFSNNLVAWIGIAGLVLASLLNVFLRQRRPKTNGCCRWANCSAAQLNSTARAPWFAFAVRANVRRRQWKN